MAFQGVTTRRAATTAMRQIDVKRRVYKARRINKICNMDQNQFNCQVCGKSFKQGYTLKEHKHRKDHFAPGEPHARGGKLALLLMRCRLAKVSSESAAIRGDTPGER